MNRVQGDVGIWTIKSNFDNHKVVNVIKILSNNLLGVSWAAVVNNKIPGSANSNLVCNMTREDELTVIPANFNLESVSTYKHFEN
jgi:hypothetical protein